MWLMEENKGNMPGVLKILFLLEQSWTQLFFIEFVKRYIERDCLNLTSRKSRKYSNPSKSEDFKNFHVHLKRYAVCNNIIKNNEWDRYYYKYF